MTRTARPRTQRRSAKHVPLRRCVVCRASKPQGELLRLYRDTAGKWQFDLRRKAGGRGAWLCAEKEQCHSPKALKRFFRTDAERIVTDLNIITSALTASAAPVSQRSAENQVENQA